MVQSVDRAVSAMEILAREDWSGVSEMADELDIHKSTAFRLLSTLEQRGLVEQDADTQKYRLGLGVLRLAGSVRSSFDLVRAARPVCDRLSVETDETVNVAILEENMVVNIHQVNHSTSRVGVDWLGSHTDLHCTSSGKVFMAHLPEHVADELLPDRLERYTDSTITDRDVLAEQLELVRRDGYSMTFEELEEGLNAVSAPVWGVDGQLVASVSVSGPSYRVHGAAQKRAAHLTRDAAAEISRRLGHVGSPQSGDRPHRSTS